MQENEKYYDIIKSLVLENKRFKTELEVYLKEIIDDIYSKSKFMIDSISDDDVLKNYLNKIIPIVLISISKKYGVKTRNESRKTFIASEIQNNTETKYETNNEPQIIEIDSTDTLINSVDSRTIDNNDEEVLEQEVSVENSEDNLAIEIVDSDDDTTEVLEQEVSVENSEDSIAPEYNNNEELQILEFNNEEDFLDTSNENIQININDDDLAIDDSGINLTEVTEDNLIEIDENKDDNMILSDDTNDDILEIDNTSSEIGIEEFEHPVDINLVDKMINGVTLNNEEDFLLQEDNNSSAIDLFEDNNFEDILVNENLTEEYEISSNEEIDITNSPKLDLVDDIDTISFEESQDAIDNLFDTSAETNLSFNENTITDETVHINETNHDFYKSFAFEEIVPENIDIDIVNQSINNATSSFENIDAEKVMILHFNENKSIDEIANELETDNNTVVEILNRIVDSVKD